MTMSQLRIQKNDPLEYILSAVSQAEDSSLEGNYKEIIPYSLELLLTNLEKLANFHFQ